ncbi:MAG TPA: plastocyanin/azurin family copper-binding protein [Ktedonobacteraceae bacterium]|nr:plastocyanin/azurin family copper-binding protein [Ktedonobacteraceae bacterium]
MVNFGQAAVGIIVLLIVVGGLLYIFYSRTNAVEKTGYGSLIMLALVCLMIPVFWISEGNNESSEQSKQFNNAVQQGMQLYAQYCTYNCYTIKNDKVANANYNGYTIEQLNNMTDDEVTRIIDAGVYNPTPTPPASAPSNTNVIPKSDQYGGVLLSQYSMYLLDFLRSANPTYLSTNGYPNHNGFNDLPAYLQQTYPKQYQAAVALGSFGQFGTPVDMTASKTITLTIVDPGTNGVTCGSQSGCFTPSNVKVKVGTVITWVNKSKLAHTVTAIQGTDTTKPTPNVFDSANGNLSNLLQSGKSFSFTVSNATYTADATNHTVNYFCRIHPDMLGELTIVQ